MPHISHIEAAARITSQLAGKRKAKGGTPPLAFIRAHGDEASPVIYEFCNPDGSRIFAPADSDLKPVLGECKKGTDMPPALQDWLQSYAEEIEWYQAVGCNLPSLPSEAPPSIESAVQYGAVSQHPITSSTPEKAPTALATIGPLINCHWHQTAPYNQMTVFGGEACKTGCWATAMAQFLYYWGCQPHDGKYYRCGCTATEAYKTRTTRQNVDALPPIAIFDYDNMPAGKPSTEAQKKAVAELMLYCGCAMKMNYAPGASSAYISDLPNVLRDKLRMGTPILVKASSGMDAFKKRIIAELEAGKPCLFRGTGDDGGHAFICDGYNPANDLFHFNWGWGGKYDGWFSLSAMQPSHYNFTSGKQAVVGIQPKVWGDVNGDGEVTIEDAYAIRDQILKGRKTEAGDVNYDGDVDVTDMMMVVKESLNNEEK